MSSKSNGTNNGEPEMFTNPSVHEQERENLTLPTTNNTESMEDEKRRRTMSQKAVQNAIQTKTVEKNAREKVLKTVIDKAQNVLQKGTHLQMDAILEPLRLAYTKYNESLGNWRAYSAKINGEKFLMVLVKHWSQGSSC